MSVEIHGSGPSVVLVDPAGAFSGMRPLDSVIPLLTTDLTVVTFDRRGRGRSTDTQPYAVQREVDDVAAVLRMVAQPATLFGFSSGAALALHAAAAQVPVGRLVLLEPAVDLDGPADTEFTADLGRLISAGRRGEAIEYFNRAIGVPEDRVHGLRSHPAWSGLKALAHTLLYDTAVTDSMTRDLLARVAAPVTVIASDGSDPTLQGWADSIAGAVQHGTVRRLPGEWHAVPAPVLARAILSTD